MSDGILCADELIVSEGSSLVCKGSNGRGIDAEDITIKAGASVSGEGVLGGVNSRSDITLEKGASLAAYTDEMRWTAFNGGRLCAYRRKSRQVSRR